MESDESKQYKIGEAARLLEVKPYVLRFWETEFPELQPVRTPSGQRMYSEVNMELLRRIKGLLYGEGLTIEGARKRLDGHDDTMEDDGADRAFMREVAEELEDILELLGGSGSPVHEE